MNPNKGDTLVIIVMVKLFHNFHGIPAEHSRAWAVSLVPYRNSFYGSLALYQEMLTKSCYG